VKYEILQPLAIRRVGDSTFVFDRNNATLHTFNETGAFLWELLETGAGTAALRERLCQAYKVGPEEAEADVSAFLNALEHKKLVSITQ